jgi:uncharacterized protein (DUF2147 family)
MRLVLSAIFLFLSISIQAQSVIGKWKTIDDETNKPRSIVEIYEKDGKMFGKIEKLFRDPGEDPDPICTECKDHRKNEKVLGMIIISDMEENEDEWNGGEILDPDNGKVYRCKIWVEDGRLKVRGYIAFLYRTQTWLPQS